MPWTALLLALSALRARVDAAAASDIANDVGTRFMALIINGESAMMNRRLSGEDNYVIEGTLGEKIAFIVEREVWANGNVSGRRLGTALGRKFAKEIDGIINNNDEGVKDGRTSRSLADKANNRRLASGRQLRASPFWGQAKSMARKGKNKISIAQRFKTSAVASVNTVPHHHHLKPKLDHFLNSFVQKTLDNNDDVLVTAIKTLADFIPPNVKHLIWMAADVLARALQEFDVHALEASNALRNSPIDPLNLKFFTFSAAGMVTMFAAALAAVRQWRKYTYVESQEESTKLVDVE